MTALRSYPEAYRYLLGQTSEHEADPFRLRAAKMAAERHAWYLENGWEARTWRPSPTEAPPRYAPTATRRGRVFGGGLVE